MCVSELTNIGSDNGLSPGRRQAIILANAGILLIGTLGTNFNEILSEIHTFSFKKNVFENIVCEIAAILYRPQCVKHDVPTSRLYHTTLHIIIISLDVSALIYVCTYRTNAYLCNFAVFKLNFSFAKWYKRLNGKIIVSSSKK